MAKKVQSIPALTAKAQKVFNAWIRKRDEGHLCISCGSFNANQAGHYLSAGHHSVHRFNEKNVHLQCSRCNLYLSGNQISYRINLVKKIGAEQVEILEGTRHNKKKWDRLELEYIIEHYKTK
jgi:hypothetical protein